MPQNTLAIIPKDSKASVEDLLETLFQENCTLPGEILIVDNSSRQKNREVMQKYSTRCFIRHIKAPDPEKVSQDFLRHKAKYEHIVQVSCQEDIQHMAQGNGGSLAAPERSNPQITQPATDQLEQATDLSRSADQLREENELLLLQLHQVQEELEEYYLKYQELKKSTESVKG